MSAGVQHAYVYERPSSLDDKRLHLTTSRAPSADGADPFLAARIVEPRAVAMAMRLVSDVVRSRHHIPAAMLERILIEADPILTFGGDVLRVEGFSSCCGMYVRADISEGALDSHERRPGTTNVDFNAEMRGALARIRDSDRLDLEVGSSGVGVTHDADRTSETVFERKVKLPLRWLRGLLEVQAIQRRMEPRLELDRADAVRFLRSLPRAGRSSDAAWVIPSGRSARLGSAPRKGAVRLSGMSRLRALERGLPLADKLVVHEDPHTGASTWQLQGRAVSLTVVLSPETWRGFSGEGQLLSQLVASEPKLAQVRAMLAWQSNIDERDILVKAGLDAESVSTALAWLSTRGLVGYDVARQGWFHRVLPFDLAQTTQLLDAQHPRLKGARKLVADGAVTIKQRQGDDIAAAVGSNDVEHRVRISPAGDRCTCTWFAKHQGERGPCKHVLAVELLLAETPSR